MNNGKSEITPEQVKELQLHILLFFKDVCTRHKLRYSLAYGTLLGAVRHKGFIPWDDDIDVMMPRPDYNKLVDILRSSDDNEKYKFISMHNNDIYFAPLAKIYDDSTILTQHYGQYEKPEIGVYIDIFIIDGLPDRAEDITRMYQRAAKLRAQWGLSCRRFSARSRNMLYAIAKSIKSIPYLIIGYRHFLEKYDKCCSAYAYENSESVGVIMFGEGEKKETTLRKHYDEFEDILFEGQYFMSIKYCDEYLRRMYGNYMELPPEDQRKPKHPHTIRWKKN